METLKTKLLSDRLWVVLLFLAVVVCNTVLSLGITDAHLTQLCFAVIAFVLGKSWRATTAHSGLIEAAVPQLIAIAPAAIDAAVGAIKPDTPPEPDPRLGAN